MRFNLLGMSSTWEVQKKSIQITGNIMGYIIYCSLSIKTYIYTHIYIYIYFTKTIYLSTGFGSGLCPCNR